MSDDFQLYEGILWEPSNGYFLLERHLERLQQSAAYFSFAADIAIARTHLLEFAQRLPAQPRKVRLELARSGSITLTDSPVKPSTTISVALAREPVQSSDGFLQHKTTRRQVFERALALRAEAQDVLLWNERGELTETCHGNLVLEIGGRKVTPPLSAGLQPGVFRAHLLAAGEIEEQTLPINALESASAAFLINSVRKWCELRLIRESLPG